MELSILNILTIIILFQLVLLVLFLVTSRKGKRISNRLLAVFFFLLALNIGDGILSLSGFYERFPRWAHLEDGFVLLFGPLLYYYTCSIVYRNFAFYWKDIFHLIPFLIVTTSLLVYYHLQSDKERQFIESAVVQRDLPAQFYVIVSLVYVHVIVYIVLAFHKVLLYREQIKQRFSTIHKISLNWLVFLLLSITLMLLLSWINVMIPVTGPQQWFGSSLLLVIIVLFLFINIVVIKGLNHSGIFAGIYEDSNSAFQKSTSAISTSEHEMVREKMENLMQTDKLFLDPELTLDVLAEKASLSPKKLSQIINTAYKKNFFDYINSYRIEEAMRILRESTDPGMTVLEAMYHSGFNSKSSFNTIFKKKTGLTPSAYRRQHVQS